ncbi:hypothetical protein LSAT2_023205 [Lamellibrachia satsuma]|nr:hypothetical protein LSAT2_023205 [Lamellibrachia satsuma]
MGGVGVWVGVVFGGVGGFGVGGGLKGRGAQSAKTEAPPAWTKSRVTQPHTTDTASEAQRDLKATNALPEATTTPMDRPDSSTTLVPPTVTPTNNLATNCADLSTSLARSHNDTN